MAALREYVSNPENDLREEAYGYGKEAEGYTNQAGLLGRLYEVSLSGQEDRAAFYALYGSDPANPEWIEYLRGILE